MDTQNVNLEPLYPKLFKVKKTVLKMLQDRGYVVDENEFGLTFEAWKESVRGKDPLSTSACKPTDETDNIYVGYYGQKMLTFETMSSFYQTLKDHNFKAGVLITEYPPSPLAKQNIQKLNDTFPIEYFEVKDLIVNITEHELVPEHIILCEDDKKKLLKR